MSIARVRRWLEEACGRQTIAPWSDDLGGIRVLGASFQDSIEEMAQESGLDEVRREVDSVKHYDIGGSIEKSVDPDGEIRKELTHDDTADSAEAADKAAPSEDEETKKKQQTKRRKAEKTKTAETTTTGPKNSDPRAAASDTATNASGDKP